MRPQGKLLVLLLGIVLLVPSAGCDWAVEGARDGAEDFVAETTKKLLEMLLPEG